MSRRAPERSGKTIFWAIAHRRTPTSAQGEAMVSPGEEDLSELAPWIRRRTQAWGASEGYELCVYRRVPTGGGYVDEPLTAQEEGAVASHDQRDYSQSEMGDEPF